MILKNLERGLRQRFADLAARQAKNPERADRHKPRPNAPPPESENQPHVTAASSPSLRRRTPRPLRRRRFHRTRNAAIFLRFGNPGRQWLRLHRSRHDYHRERSEAVSFRHSRQTSPRHGSENHKSRCGRNRRSNRAQPHINVPLSRRPRNDRPKRSSTAGCTPAISAASIPPAICNSSAAKKT